MVLIVVTDQPEKYIALTKPKRRAPKPGLRSFPCDKHYFYPIRRSRSCKKVVWNKVILIIRTVSPRARLNLGSMLPIIPNRNQFNFLIWSKDSRVDMPCSRGLHADSRGLFSHDSTRRIVFSRSNGGHEL